MALKPRLETLDGLPEAIAAEYKPIDGGGFQLDVTPDGGLELVDTTGLKTSLQRERTAKNDALKKLKDFEGLDPAKAREALTTVENLGDLDELKTLDEKLAERQKQLDEKYETERNRLVAKYNQDLESANAKNKSLTEQLHGELVNNAAMHAISEMDGIPELLLPVVTRNVKVVEDESGKFVAKVFGSDGQVRLSPKSGNSTDMTIGEYVGELRNSDVFSRAFKGTDASGGGSATPANPRGNNPTKQHQIRASDARDRQKYLAAQEAATKAGVQLQVVDD